MPVHCRKGVITLHREREDELKEMSGANVYSIFIDRVKAIRSYHRQFPHVIQPEEDPEMSMYTRQ